MCFSGLHSGLERLRNGHDASLKRLTEALDRPASVIETFKTMFRREINTGPTLRLAIGESLAHLNYLVKKGIISRSLGHGGIHQYVRGSAAGLG
ncbi:hypothetical protein [Noviherbaspirillum pedocola]|uniref:hypothetical protein n=1 Tax=Noviherbaspirillum pedocola TaxID=2801341 RepID=UPI0038990143